MEEMLLQVVAVGFRERELMLPGGRGRGNMAERESWLWLKGERSCYCVAREN